MKPYPIFLLIFIVFCIAVIITRSCNPEPNPSIEKTAEARKEDIKKSDSLGVIVDSVIVDRWRTKMKYDTIIKEVLMYDSTETNAAFDSTVKTKNNAVVLFYKQQRDSIQLAKMDSVHVIDTMIISLLRASNLKADTIILKLQKDVRSERNKKVFWQFVAGALALKHVLK